jgi:hypothetical protein
LALPNRPLLFAGVDALIGPAVESTLQYRRILQNAAGNAGVKLPGQNRLIDGPHHTVLRVKLR